MSASPAASGRLSHLLALADQGPALRTALAEEVADLLTHWPTDYPADTRAMLESLLVRCARDVDPHARARLRVQLCIDPDLADRVLPRSPGKLATACMLVEAARSGGDIVPALAAVLGVDEEAANAMLNDENSAGLAQACKHAGIDRAAFSALVMTRHKTGEDCRALLDCFDNVGTTTTHPPVPDGARAS